jgi:methylmalonyl-CoA mutase, N-terminal domain
MQKEIAAAAYEYQRQIESSEKVVVGVNKYIETEQLAPPVFKIDDSIRKLQTEKLNQLKAERNNEIVNNKLKSIEQFAKDGTNLMPIIIESVEEYATLGEIADTLRSVYGEYRSA